MSNAWPVSWVKLAVGALAGLGGLGGFGGLAGCSDYVGSYHYAPRPAMGIRPLNQPDRALSCGIDTGIDRWCPPGR